MSGPSLSLLQASFFISRFPYLILLLIFPFDLSLPLWSTHQSQVHQRRHHAATLLHAATAGRRRYDVTEHSPSAEAVSRRRKYVSIPKSVWKRSWHRRKSGYRSWSQNSLLHAQTAPMVAKSAPLQALFILIQSKIILCTLK